MPFFDAFFEIQPTAFGRWLQSKKAHKVLERLQRHHPRLERMLEIGPGWGELANRSLAAHIDYHAVEKNLSRALHLQKQGVSITIVDVPPISMKNQEFDAVVAHNVLEHMPDFRMAVRLLNEMVRVTRPQGLVCINCPDYLSAGKHFWDADYTHNFPVTMRRLTQMFQDQGLEIVDKAFFAGPISGPSATFLDWMVRLFPGEGIVFWTSSTIFQSRIHRARMTFMRNIFMIGRKGEWGR